MVSEPTEPTEVVATENVAAETEVTTDHAAHETSTHNIDSSPATENVEPSEFLRPSPVKLAEADQPSATKTKRRKIDALLFGGEDRKLTSDQLMPECSKKRSYSPPPSWDTPNNRHVFNTKVKNVYESRGERLAREILGVKAPEIPLKPASVEQARRNGTAPMKHEKEDLLSELSEPEKDEMNYPPTEEQLVGPTSMPWGVNNIISDITQWDVKWLDTEANKPPIHCYPMPDEFDSLSSYQRYDTKMLLSRSMGLI